MLNIEDLQELFNDYLDTNFNCFEAHDIKLFPSEILEQFPPAYDKLFKEYRERLGVVWVPTIDDDGYYQIESLLNEEY